MPVTALTSKEAIRDTMDTLVTDDQVTAFINDASLWCTEELAAEGYSTDRLELIARYLTCALVRCRDLGLVSQTINDAREQYQVDPKVSEYLTRAASFDSSGIITRTFIRQAPDVKMRVGTTFAHPHHRRYRT